ncbi:MAG: FHA domain-containing protein [Pedosphaera sp.]|nr:FHA domain-containing protein [Pedosphaera sp.]
MAKLVILSQGLTGKTHELKVDKTTIGRVDDNTLPITEPSVSSHHCEVLLRGTDVVVKDLNSTNGTFINGEKVTGEAPLKPGQILRLGRIELRLETDAPMPASKKPVDSTMVIQRGVSLTDLEAGARGGFDTSGTGFSKKTNKGNRMFLIAAIVIGVVIVALVLIALLSASKPTAP